LERQLRGLLAGVRIGTEDALAVSFDLVVQLARNLVANPPEDRRDLSQRVRERVEQWEALPDQELSLMCALRVFLPSTLFICKC